MRVVLDARPIQDPERSPLAAAYLGSLLAAYDAEPLAGESFALLLRSDLDDPTAGLAGLDVVGRRLLPPTMLLRSGALTVDPFILRGASFGAAWRVDRSGAAGAVYHAVGGGTLPLAPDIPLVATLLDLAPWELPRLFQATAVTRFGQRLRAQQLRDAAAVIVGTQAVAATAGRRLHLRPDRVRVVALAAREPFGPDPAPGDGEVAERLGVRGPYLVYAGRYDARHDLATLLRALAALAAAGRPDGLDATIPWPPRVVLTEATPADRASVARDAAREGVGDALAYAAHLEPERVAGLLRGAHAVLLPVRSEATGLAAVEAIATGTPVIASSIGPLPELVGPAGLLVEPGDAHRLAVALRAVWLDEHVRSTITTAARERARGDRRTWADVARDTRAIYAEVGASRR
jgi:glycosyltransferase involved in cell wall biosynthesis